MTAISDIADERPAGELRGMKGAVECQGVMAIKKFLKANLISRYMGSLFTGIIHCKAAQGRLVNVSLRKRWSLLRAEKRGGWLAPWAAVALIRRDQQT